MNKTIIDAVNEFKGEWPEPRFDAYNDNEPCIVLSKDTVSLDGDSYEEDVMYTGGTKCSSAYFVVVCVEREFNDLVSQMETNFGKCSDVAVNHWKKCTKVLLTKSTKELEVMDIDWSKAPEYYDYHLSYKINRDNNGFCCVGIDNSYCFTDGSNASNTNDWIITPRPQPALTYTQAMADNGEFLPSVNMIIKHKGVKKIVIGELDFNNKLALKSVDNELYSLGHIEDIKPLTPPIELIDGECYQFDSPSKLIMKGFYSYDEKEFVTVRCTVKSSACTNIQPLTVKE